MQVVSWALNKRFHFPTLPRGISTRNKYIVSLTLVLLFSAGEGHVGGDLHLPDADDVVGVAGVERLPVRGPAETRHLRRWRLRRPRRNNLRLQLVNNALVLKILKDSSPVTMDRAQRPARK